MKFKMEIDMDNPLFDHLPEKVIGDLLLQVIERVESGRIYGDIFNPNGDSVGTFELTEL